MFQSQQRRGKEQWQEQCHFFPPGVTWIQIPFRKWSLSTRQMETECKTLLLRPCSAPLRIKVWTDFFKAFHPEGVKDQESREELKMHVLPSEMKMEFFSTLNMDGIMKQHFLQDKLTLLLNTLFYFVVIFMLYYTISETVKHSRKRSVTSPLKCLSC